MADRIGSGGTGVCQRGLGDHGCEPGVPRGDFEDMATAEGEARDCNLVRLYAGEPARELDRRLVIGLLLADPDYLAGLAAALAEIAEVEGEHGEAD